MRADVLADAHDEPRKAQVYRETTHPNVSELTDDEMIVGRRGFPPGPGKGRKSTGGAGGAASEKPGA